MNMLFKVVAIVFGVLFMVSAVLQYNDPDAFLWIVIWGVAGILSFGLAFNRIPTAMPTVAGVVAVIGFFYCYPEKFEGFEIGQGDIKNVEEGREAFGLLIIGMVLLILCLGPMINRKSKV